MDVISVNSVLVEIIFKHSSDEIKAAPWFQTPTSPKVAKP
jgi:hypothetical protein